ncbi:unnamed protein product [Rotaria sp. Silwood2]|nr:unnamed protein product [Rotaria sp. Silwood2]CAF2926951.1 unnamed protein product [Rotaria sp. Silwood2]CAF3187930.1 unnamed protein product [Rotaria sp. Silwood2]CAF3426053.1 unnamed protein product [Rotaria sp. Silwood2]CAF4255380.1 unnamed protein product [Rotaria sp. Silwood2]
MLRVRCPRLQRYKNLLNNISDTESDDYELSQLYRSSHHLMLSLTDDDKTKNNSIAIIRIDYNYANILNDQNNEAFNI